MSTATEKGRREGRRRKNVELTLIEQEQKEFLLIARRKLLELVRPGRRVTMDDLREHLTIPASVRGKMLGAIPQALAKAGAIRRDGFRESTRPTSNGRYLSSWMLNDAAAADKWLAEHPGPIPPTAPVVQKELLFDAGGAA